MCGICGTFEYQGRRALDVPMLRGMRDAMTHRGPDGFGEWSNLDHRVWFGHRRLAIIDLSSGGAQPMLSADGKIVVTFNGEIYNFKALRKDLELEGRVFRTNSDTEILIELYRSKGPEFVSYLRGMFAFALWDSDRERLILGRDPYGIKPLYYADVDGQISFASSVKAIISDSRLSRTADAAGVAGFFVFGSVPEPWTIYEAIRAVPAGSILLIDRNGVRQPHRYHSIAQVISEAEVEDAASGKGIGSAPARLREAMLDSVRHHLVADVPVGAFLSSGVDSGALVGLMRDAGQSEIQTITLTYDEFDDSPANEAPLAELVARHYGASHVTQRVTASDFYRDLPKIVAAMDQPSIDGINTWFVAKAAHERGLKVAISGVGGDELLGGYDTFVRVPRMVKLLSGLSRIYGLADLIGVSVGAVRSWGGGVPPKYAGLLRFGGSIAGAYLLRRCIFLPTELGENLADPEFLRRELNEISPLNLLARAISDGPRTSHGKVATLESSFYLRNQLLRDTDWASMAHSLEVRTPLVDHVLLGQLAGVMSEPGCPSGKAMLAAAPSKPLPNEIVSRKKTGFGIPVEAWLAKMPGLATAKNQERQFSRNWARRVAEWNNILPSGTLQEV